MNRLIEWIKQIVNNYNKARKDLKNIDRGISYVDSLYGNNESEV